MKKTAVFLFALLFMICLSSCSGDEEYTIPEGAFTIEGCYKTDELNVEIGYVFNSDGFGYQFIGEETYQISYYILGNKITIENFSVDGGIKTTFEYSKGDGYIRISGIRYDKVEVDEMSSAEIS